MSEKLYSNCVRDMKFIYEDKRNIVQWNLAKRGMEISDPIFPIEMDLAKRGILSSIFSILEVGDGPKTFSHHLVMQHFEVYLHFYKFKLF